ncbi:22820_t:CDS:1 [Cetraspora pellucida]|uniref:22820_t:CDS:1 n=1 Tax=Cetraspora pellucida TaxID=1433469 RepID=A0A9N9CEC6_9GLOM|nr:22820_t:CDS:1 [Cetraspora pellucida]
MHYNFVEILMTLTEKIKKKNMQENATSKDEVREIENKNQVQKKLGEKQEDNSTIINNPTIIESAKEAVVPTFQASGDEETKAAASTIGSGTLVAGSTSPTSSLAQPTEKIGEASGNEAMREKGKEIENNFDEKQENDSTISNNPILIETKEAVSIGGDRALAAGSLFSSPTLFSQYIMML